MTRHVNLRASLGCTETINANVLKTITVEEIVIFMIVFKIGLKCIYKLPEEDNVTFDVR